MIHTAEVDSEGNPRFDGADLTENLVTKAADRTFVTTERTVDTDAFVAASDETDIPGFLVDCVAEGPYGAHPTTYTSNYESDADHLRSYFERSREGDLGDYFAKCLGGDD